MFQVNMGRICHSVLKVGGSDLSLLHSHLLGLIAVSDGDVVSGVGTRFRSLLHCSQLGAISMFFLNSFLFGHSFP